jgi:8-oxo-dGTP diphosphatase
MKLIATIHNQDAYPRSPEINPAAFAHREAARAVVFDGAKVALLKVNKHNYYKLPGGGIEPGEDALTGLAREALEEIGCHVEITGEIGQIVEYRDQWRLRQTSYCYIANKIGDSAPPDFTAEELDVGFEIVWAPNINTAIKLVRDTRADDTYESTFIQRRDMLFLLHSFKDVK